MLEKLFIKCKTAVKFYFKHELQFKFLFLHEIKNKVLRQLFLEFVLLTSRISLSVYVLYWVVKKTESCFCMIFFKFNFVDLTYKLRQTLKLARTFSNIIIYHFETWFDRLCIILRRLWKIQHVKSIFSSLFEWKWAILAVMSV